MLARAPGGFESGPEPLTDLRAQAAAEARRLREAASAPDYERRELLADLGSRLDALVRDLPPDERLEAVRHLVTELADDRPLKVSAEAFADLWSRALRLLDELAGTSAFWK
jgi:Ca-activated chloride channel family protein